MMIPSRPRQNTVALAGWLFADLLLGIAMFFLVANSIGARQPPATPTLVPTATAMPRPTSTPFPTPFPTSTPFVSLNPEPFAFDIRSTPNALLAPSSTTAGRQERARILRILEDQIRERCATSHAGILLIFGHASNPTEGGQLAQAAAEIIQDAQFTQLCGEVVPRDFHWIDNAAANRGLLNFEIFFFNR